MTRAPSAVPRFSGGYRSLHSRSDIGNVDLRLTLTVEATRGECRRFTELCFIQREPIMAEHIVAVFDSEGAAEAAVRDLEQAGISASAIRTYRSTAASAGSENSGAVSPTGHSSTGGFWAWLLGEEPGAETTRSLSLDEQAYEQHAQAGKAVISVLVEDDAKIHQAVTLITAHHPIEMEEQTEELNAESSPETGPGYSPHAGLAGSTAESSGVAAQAKPSSGTEEVIQLAEENLAIGKRTVDRGTTRVRRYVVERPVERDVTLHGQRVTIERRRPVETSVPGHAFEERTVEVRETEEVPVVEKTARVVEEVAIRKEETERTEKVHDTVRREEVEVIDNKGRQTSP